MGILFFVWQAKAKILWQKILLISYTLFLEFIDARTKIGYLPSLL